MASATNSFTLLAPPEAIWRALADFNRWGSYVVLENAGVKGWGNRWTASGAPGVGLKLSMFDGQRLMQEWEVDEWTPPSRLKASSRAAHGNPSLTMESSLEVTVTAVSAAESQVQLRVDSRFNHPLYGLILSIVPLKRELAGLLAAFERGLIAVLSGG